MMNQSTVDQIVLLLAQDQLSIRQIATRVGVSHASVANIAKGTRGTYGTETSYEPLTPHAGRCPHCGAKVYLPCVACRAREYRRRQLRHGLESRPLGEFESPRVA